MDRVEEQEVEKILNKRKVREVVKYLVWWKRFIVEYDSWEKKEDLENTKEIVAEFKERINMEVRRQKKLKMVEEKDFRRGELSGKYTAKMLYRQNNRKFENKYLKRLERNWKKQKGKDKMIWGDKISSSWSRNLKERVLLDL